MEENIKNGFNKVKADIDFLNDEILNIKITLNELTNELKNTLNQLESYKKETSTLRQINTTNPVTSTHSSTVPQEVGGLKPLNMPISTGNEGASTDRQTDRQTDTSTHNSQVNEQISEKPSIIEATEILETLDSLKKELRRKFKHLTSQEMTVFSSIYQLEDQGNTEITYKLLSKNLRLSESSVRDYVQRMTTKGIPIKKNKIDNKKIFLSISADLKKIATLHTIIRLREL